MLWTHGTLLGATQAEADHAMLQKAFLQTPDYDALRYTTDFNYCVGRRGTGKSALFLNLSEMFKSDSGVILLTEQPNDYEMVELQSVLQKISNDYRVLRPITRLLWTAHFLIEAARKASEHYRFSKSRHNVYLSDYLQNHQITKYETGTAQCLRILKKIVTSCVRPEEIPHAIASALDINQLGEAIKETLAQTQLNVVALYDRLDEAWVPDTPAISILGGLAKTAADYRERHYPLYPVLFVRDNMFRALAHQDDDFTRYIEGHTLRLQWDEESLFSLVVARLRVALGIEALENNVKVWNRFAHRELKGRDGFIRCLRHTLYRPRDILVLLNQAYMNAKRDGRTNIIGKDIEKTAVDISQHRLDDLCKEYEGVLPGLRSFIAAFRGQPVKRSFAEVTEGLQALIEASDYSQPSDRELELFGTGGNMFAALYSVGFIGFKDDTSQSYTFCHDGTMSAIVEVPEGTETLVHPCYWKALDGSLAQEDEKVAIQVNDEYTVPPTGSAVNLRLQRLGRLPEELAGVPSGHAGSKGFERWVLRAVRLLLSGQLQNIELKPNPGNAMSQRDIVGTNATTSSFWERILEDYGTRQVIFECKNYSEAKPEDFRQVLDYAHGGYGNLSFIVRRGEAPTLTPTEQGRTRAMFYEHGRLIVILPTNLLVLCIRKMRTTKKYDYTEFTFAKHLDYIVRSVLSLTHVPKFRTKRRK